MDCRSRILAFLVVAFLVSACSGGGGLIEVVTPSGRTLDCPDELIASSVADLLANAVGADTAQEALDILSSPDRPKGRQVVEESGVDETVFLFLDDDGNRLGRVGTGRQGDRGWFVLWVEKCGSE